MSSINTFTCTACASSFNSSEEQRAHYKLDWHRYNLKRKVSGLSPVSQEDFERRLAAVAEAAGAKTDFKGQCKECRKTFSSEKLFQQHLESKKHQLTVAAKAGKPSITASTAVASLTADADAVGAGGPASADEQHTAAAAASAAADTTQATDEQQEGEQAAAPEMSMEENSDEEVDDESEAGGQREEPDAPIGPDICIFCNLRSASLEANCKHMLEKHGFFIPDAEYLIDPEGLVMYCSEKVKLGHICLVCNGRGRTFFSWRSVQQHMTGLAHCRLCYEEGEDLHEFEPFYDFRASYGADAAASDDDAAEGSSDGEHSGERPAVVERTLEVTHLGELQLLDGRVVGHRQYDRYYKQAAPRGEDTRAAIKAARGEQHLRLCALYGEEAVAAAAAANGGQLQLQRGGGRHGALSLGVGPRGANANLSGGKDLQHLRREQWRAKRESLKQGVAQNRLNRTFTRVYEA